MVRGNVIFTIANALRRLLLMFFPRVLGMFLLGFYAGRAGIFANLDAHAALLRRVCAIGFAVGLPLSLLASVFSTDGPRPPDLRGLGETVLQSIWGRRPSRSPTPPHSACCIAACRARCARSPRWAAWR